MAKFGISYMGSKGDIAKYKHLITNLFMNGQLQEIFLFLYHNTVLMTKDLN
jgi:hypothetical protein